MNKYLKIDPWCIIEDTFSRENHPASESIFSLGNGRFGQRANFEESYSGESLQGNYIAGVYYPDKTRVGWWKNGYPEYFAKILNAPNWIGIEIQVGGELVDLAKAKVLSFRRTLNMKEGILYREYHIELASGKQLKANITRFLSMKDPELGIIRYSLVPVNFSGRIGIISSLDAGIKNADANYDEYFWDEVAKNFKDDCGYITSRTRKTEFDVCLGITTRILNGEEVVSISPTIEQREKYLAFHYTPEVSKGGAITILKYAAVQSSLYHKKEDLMDQAELSLKKAAEKGFENLLREHKERWEEKWKTSDILIEGDDEAQQGIRFNIFQLNQTYTGDDERLNIGPKGFTGEKYGGVTYWDTEAYCLPFFLCTAPSYVARNLVFYRYKQLGKAIENGEKLGFTEGAALYPMVTINGEECHNEWEITFEEIHRNGAIAHAIYNYVRHTGDKRYLIDYGLEVLIAISRFWRQRVNFSESRKKWVMLGVTGPNEYENNVNNNWYTNTIASWTLSYTIQLIAEIKNMDEEKYKILVSKVRFNEQEEIPAWEDIIENMYYPIDKESGIFLQQDGYLDKEQITTDQLDPAQQPINQHWSWDRILRSCFIKQADVLQGIYLFEDHYDTETIRKNFEFYESRTVHESSLSPCVHSILAARLSDMEMAYKLYLRTSRLDLDDYNNEVDEGLHITSMAGTWMSVIEGFAGKRVRNGRLVLNPQIPEQWESYSFKILFRGSRLKVKVTPKNLYLVNESNISAALIVLDESIQLNGQEEKVMKMKK
ncbi:MAG: glycoside hydrolase family 65 protein [Bacteroidales bacterium]|nr:glycoside hydrolase family 65 protein [Bacteroidales bacterium]